MDRPYLLQLAISACFKAGAEILKVYETDFEVDIKNDSTPVTQADKNASACILKVLSESNIPVLCEEGTHFDYTIRKNWNMLWIVDPLDGTKEFVKRNGEFTINIALIENNVPVIGVIYSPVFRNLYFSDLVSGSFKVNGHDILEIENNNLHFDTIKQKAQKLPLQSFLKPYTIVASRSHLSKQVSERISKARYMHHDVSVINTGSSIKFCLVAEGLAHEYPRFGTTMEWDTAAGQCIVNGAGGKVIDLATKESMIYNRENLKNNDFIVLGSSVENDLR